MIKKKKFLENDNVADMTELLGEKLDMEAEFDNLDNENKEKVEILSPPMLFEFLILGYSVPKKGAPWTIHIFSGYVLWNNKLGLQEDHEEEHCCKKVEWCSAKYIGSHFQAVQSQGGYFYGTEDFCRNH